jgi:hypothetical protein
VDFRGVLLGLKASVIASGCCGLPLVLAAVFSVAGVGSVSAALPIPRYKWFFVGAGFLFLVSSLYLTVRRRCGSCSLGDVRGQGYLIVAGLASFVLFTVLLVYVLLPSASGWLFSIL